MDGDNLSSLPSAALRAYEQLLTVEHGTAAKWSTLAGSLRAEADRWPEFSDQRRKRLDRAVDCEVRTALAVKRILATQNGGAL